MRRLVITTRIAADGVLHLPVKEFADQDVQITVSPVASQTDSPPAPLIGADALRKAQEIGFVGRFEAEADFSLRCQVYMDTQR